MTDLLVATGLHAGYGSLKILEDVSVRVAPAEVVTVIGPNGAGKSTLMKAIFGLIRPERGTVSFDGQPITGLKASALARLGMGFVPQSENVFPSLTIEENLKMGGAILKQDIRPRIEGILDQFPSLRKRLRALAGTLSGGERQMLAIGRAMMLEPRLLLLDEPSAGLSPRMTEEVLHSVAALARGGMSFLLIEQNARQALAVSDRGYVLVAGRNKLEGRGPDLLDNPEIGRLYLGG